MPIPKEEGIIASQHFLSSCDATMWEHTQMLVEMIRLVLDNNVFLHNGSWFCQCQGVAIGWKFSPSFANLFMGWLEKNYIWRDCPEDLMNYVVNWGRYIDDVLMIWTGGQTLLLEFCTFLNNNQCNIEFTYEHNSTEIAFLDLILYIINDTIASTLYRKNTACNSVLHAQSSHPRSQVLSIPFGEMMTIRRNCSEDVAFRS